MCAECHSTDLRKNFDAKQDRFATTFSEIDVSCEACHGPGSNHVAWARREGDWRRFDAGQGARGRARRAAERPLDDRRLRPATRSAAAPATATREVEICGRCHARASKISDDYRARRAAARHASRRAARGRPLLERRPDARRGLRLRLVPPEPDVREGRDLRRLPRAPLAEAPRAGRAPSARSATCRRSTPRRSITSIPRARRARSARRATCPPSRTCRSIPATIIPCGSRGPIARSGWARRTPATRATRSSRPSGRRARSASAIRSRSPATRALPRRSTPRARGEPGARQQLTELVRSREQPPIVRASALRAPRRASSTRRRSTRCSGALGDPDPLVRGAAVEAAAELEPALRKRLLSGVLGDPVRSVRIQAARALASLPPAGLSGAQRAALEKGVAEWIAVQEFNADRPESHTNLGALRAERGESEQALAEFAKALEIDPHFTPAVANRADLLRALGREAEAEATPARGDRAESAGRRAASRARALAGPPEPARGGAARARPVRAARTRRRAARLRLRRGAARPGPDARRRPGCSSPRSASSPNDRDLLFALASFLQEAGETQRALAAARRLVELEPQDPRARELLARLEASPRTGRPARGPS